MILRVSLKYLRKGHTQSCYLPPHELRLLDWIPGFTSEPNVGHLSLAKPHPAPPAYSCGPVEDLKYLQKDHIRNITYVLSFFLFVGCFYSCLLYPECWFVCDLSP
jgi:hypothetical protein